MAGTGFEPANTTARHLLLTSAIVLTSSAPMPATVSFAGLFAHLAQLR